jgi:hypothetical protein
MFGWLRKRRSRQTRDQLTSLRLRLLAEARDLQRNGDIVGFAAKTAAAAAVERQLADLDGAGAATDRA